MRTIKLIWDFKGEDAEQTAIHHAKHLREFIEKHTLELKEVGTEQLNQLHTIAFMLVEESKVFEVRDALMPHRAEVV